ncbi:MAG TPA: sigma 54-interacting transcriptional regulator [Syntrophorhabdaceae bacterium]|nr:sigma 54-interacting transcriptional regulator [Syntrophorhabdaceae bacterium]
MTTHEKDIFQEVTLRICGSLDLETGMRSCIAFLRQVMPAKWLSVHLWQPDLGAAKTVFVADEEGGETVDVLHPLSIEVREKFQKFTFGERVLVDRAGLEPVAVHIVNRPSAEPATWSVAQYFVPAESSLMLMFLRSGGRPLGSMVVSVEGCDRYTEEHARLLGNLHEPFAIAVSNALEHQEVLRLKDIIADDNRYLHRELFRLSGDEIVGLEFGLRDVAELVGHVAPLDSPVLVRGETGVGKDVIANALHYSSSRKDGPFIKVNCGAIPESLIDSELFGHEKGSFTGAIAQKRGCFERAHHGTIFLDEIGELPPAAQVRLLRVLQYKEIQRVGGTASIPVDIRIITATHRPLEEMVKTGNFREDLWFRLNVFPIVIPPLRDRKVDIPALTRHFLRRRSKDLKLPAAPVLAPGAIDQLMAYDWPGNVRELENVLERALILSKGESLVFDRILSPPPKYSARQDGEKGLRSLDDVISSHIMHVLEEVGGKVHGPGGAAEVLGINASTLRSKMNKLGIQYGRQTDI